MGDCARAPGGCQRRTLPAAEGVSGPLECNSVGLRLRKKRLGRAKSQDSGTRSDFDSTLARPSAQAVLQYQPPSTLIEASPRLSSQRAQEPAPLAGR